MTTTPARRAALVEHARLVIKRGSQSFSAASQLFDDETRQRAWLLYAWCRRCDDIADNQDMGGELGDQSGAEQRLKSIRLLTRRALEAAPGARRSGYSPPTGDARRAERSSWAGRSTHDLLACGGRKSELRCLRRVCRRIG